MRPWFIAALLAINVCVVAVSALAQTTPTGTLTGKITDPDGLGMPGATVTVTSPALQGSRTTVTSTNGDYVIPFLPPGEYTVVVELSGFQTHQQQMRIQVANTVTMNAQLKLGGVAETVTVKAESANDFTLAAGVMTSLKADTINTLPVARDINGAALLAPGTTDGGYRGAITFGGALSYEGLFLLNGVVVSDTIRGTARDLFIEDSIEETKTSSASISAEFGRFSGGVVNTITKSGGNSFSGSFRTTMSNEKWRARTPIEASLPADPRVSQVIPTYEATFGGPILKDKVWFFAATRYVNLTSSELTAFTNVAFERTSKDTRIETKGTWSITPQHTIKGSFTKRPQSFTNNYQSAPFMDLKYLWNATSQSEDLVSANYSGVIRKNFFLEGQYSQRRYFILGEGSHQTDFVNGTTIYDISRGNAKWNAPGACAVCGPDGTDDGAEENRNKNAIVKATLFLSTSKTGSHTIVLGGDVFQDGRKQNVYAAGGSMYRFYVGQTIVRGTDLYPSVVPNVAYFQWNPVNAKAIPQALRTYSAFANDDWRLSNTLSFNLGLRFDKVDAKDGAGSLVIKKDTLSPRLSATFSPGGSGKWTINTGAARYVMSATSLITEAGSAAGKQSVYQFWYQGPAINSDINTATPVATATVLTSVFDWFFANGGNNRPYKQAPRLPGISRKAGPSLITPDVWEYSVGIGRQLGPKGSFRIDGVFRRYGDFYADQTDMTTGKVADPTGKLFDLDLIVNTNHVERAYKALMTQVQYQFTPRVGMGGNYTLSKNHGSFEGENDTTGAITDITPQYPEYNQLSWNSPMGDLTSDRRHKARIWGSYLTDLGRGGRLDFGAVLRLTSGKPFGAIGSIDSRPYVTNPGYLTPPSLVSYFFTARDAFRTDMETATDLSVNYSLRIGVGKTELFARFVVANLFNQAAYTGGGTRTELPTVITNATDKTLPAFNPFTTQPVEGVNYRVPATFGTPLVSADYQAPRRFYTSMGIRF